MATTNMYPGTFNKDVVMSKDAGSGIACAAGVYTPIGEYVVKADERVGIGRGSYDSQSTAVGHLFAEFFNNASPAVQFTAGTLRILLESSQGMPIGSRPVYLDVDLAQIATGKTTPSERYALPFEDLVLSEDRVFKFLIKNNTGSSVTLVKSASTVIIDTTRVLI